MSGRQGLPKKERLKSRKKIDSLFLNGRRFVQFPVRVTYRFLPTENAPLVQLGVTAAKKNFKKATDRNRIKRLLREAWRLQKTPLQERMNAKGLSGEVFLMYTDKVIAPFESIRDAVGKSITRLLKAAESDNEDHT